MLRVRRALGVAGVLAAVWAVIRWLATPVLPGGGAEAALLPAAEGVGGVGAAARAGFLLLHVEEVLLADAADFAGATRPAAPGYVSPMGRGEGGEMPWLPVGRRLPPGAVAVLYETLALDRPVLRRGLVLERLPAEVAGTRHLRRLSGGGLRVMGVAADGTVTLTAAGRRVELAPGEGWGVGWAEGVEGRGGRKLPQDRAGWSAAVREARRRGELVTSLSVFNRGWWRVRLPAQ